MTARVRSCQSCKHYEPSAMWRRGWCRNPRLYGPQQSHMVDQDALDCSRGLGDAWQPAGDDRVGPWSERKPLFLFGAQMQPMLAAPGGANLGAAPVFMSSTGGGGGGGLGSGPAGGPGQPGQPGGRGERLIPTGQERTVSFQPEERYWTDYLRIALPVIGLLVLVGLLWWWAGRFIGGTGEDPPVAAVTEVPEIINPPPATPTPIATPPPIVVPTGPPPTEPAAQPNVAAPAETPPPAAAGNETQVPAGDPGDCSDRTYPAYQVGETVVTTDTVNLRQSASTASSAVTQLAPGTPVEVTGSFEDFPDPACDWWPVTIGDDSGFVREDFLQRPAQ